MISPPPLDLSTDEHGSWRILRVRGDLDMATGPRLEAAALNGGPPRRLALDLSGVDFIDSSGLRGILRIRREAPELALVAPGTLVLRLLSLTKLTEAFRVVDSVEELDGSG